jgi:hypothetical protein
MATTWLNEQYPEATVNCVNAGLSGTPSVLGNMRLERDVLACDPDIVFVEFAVNDGGETIYKNAYESLVRTLLADERDIAVVLLFTIVENGHTCQPHMSKIGEHYDIPYEKKLVRKFISAKPEDTLTIGDEIMGYFYVPKCNILFIASGELICR